MLNFRIPNFWRGGRSARLDVVALPKGVVFSSLRVDPQTQKAMVWLSPAVCRAIEAYERHFIARKMLAEVAIPPAWIEHATATTLGTVPPRTELRQMIRALLEAGVQSAFRRRQVERALLVHAAVVREMAERAEAICDEVDTRLQRYLDHVAGNRELVANADAVIAAIARRRAERARVLSALFDDLTQMLATIDSDGLRWQRGALLGPAAAAFRFFGLRLLFGPPRHDQVLAHYYALFGVQSGAPDHVERLFDIARAFLEAVAPPADPEIRRRKLMVPGNASRLFGAVARNREQASRLRRWARTLERDAVLHCAAAAYEAAALSDDYPQIPPSRLKGALLSDAAMRSLAGEIEHGGASSASLHRAATRVHRLKRHQRDEIAVCYFRDFTRYFGDLEQVREFEQLLEKFELCTAPADRNARDESTYEFLLPGEKALSGRKISAHVIVKAEIRQSGVPGEAADISQRNAIAHLTRQFVQPLNRMLPEFGGEKIAVESDGVIAAFYEYENQQEAIVCRACAMTKLLLETIESENQRSRAAGLPALEVGIGVSFCDGAPGLLADGETPVVISPAVDASHRLASCSGRARAALAASGSSATFRRTFQVEFAEEPDQALPINIGGIRLDAPAFERVLQENRWTAVEVTATLPFRPMAQLLNLRHGIVAAAGRVIPLILHQSRAARIGSNGYQGEGSSLSYEVCTSPELYREIQHIAGQGHENLLAEQNAGEMASALLLPEPHPALPAHVTLRR
jgi:hypothetical protein